MKLHLALLAASIAALATPAFAATQGTPGPTSTGTVTINASITPEVNISGLDDITFTATRLRTSLAQGSDPTEYDDMCVWSNNPDGSYYVTATGDGAANAFTLTDGTRTLPYSVNLTDSNTRGRALVASVKSAVFTSNATTPDCGGATNSTVNVTLANADIAAMEATTTYTGVLTLLVTPS